VNGGGNIRPESKRRRKACLELYETLRGGLELAEDALCSLVPALVANQRDGDYALIWNCLSDGLEVRFVMTYVF